MTLFYIIENIVYRIQKQYQVNKVGPLGETFQNRFLSYHTEKRLKGMGKKVFQQRQVPCNGGGIPLGQISVAAKKQGTMTGKSTMPVANDSLPDVQKYPNSLYIFRRASETFSKLM